jgi:hypothetical protein
MDTTALRLTLRQLCVAPHTNCGCRRGGRYAASTKGGARRSVACRLGLRGARGVPNPRGIERNRRHRDRHVIADKPICRRFGMRQRLRRLPEIVVSPVRVRVSPSGEVAANRALLRLGDRPTEQRLRATMSREVPNEVLNPSDSAAEPLHRRPPRRGGPPRRRPPTAAATGQGRSRARRGECPPRRRTRRDPARPHALPQRASNPDASRHCRDGR